MDLLVLADDLTGANDTGAAFAGRGFRTVVRRGTVRSGWPPTVAVGVVDTDSRYTPSEAAYERVREAVSQAPEAPVYAKVDSTLRGNLVAIVDAALDATGAALAVVAPAYPPMDRRTVGGFHLVDGRPVAETAAGEDPRAPVTTSHLPTRLADASHPVASISLDAFESGALAETFAASAEPGGTIAVCDATGGEHLDRIAVAAASIDEEVVYVGSAGLAHHVRLGPPRAVLGVVGSHAPETLDQLARLPAEDLVGLAPSAVVSELDAEVARAADAIVDRLELGRQVVVSAAVEASDVAETRRAGRDAGLDDAETAARVESALARVAERVQRRVALDGLFVTGGAVANATLEALEATGITLSSRVVEEGVPIGRVVDGPAAELPIVTKAGAFGSETTILNCLRSLATHHDRESSRRHHDG